jgi:hypothetical protein
LINSKKQQPFFYEQILDQDGLPIASVWRANRFVDYLIARKNKNHPRHLVIAMTRQYKVIAGNKYVNFAKRASAKHMIPAPLNTAIMEIESSFNLLALILGKTRFIIPILAACCLRTDAKAYLPEDHILGMYCLKHQPRGA